MLVLLMCAVLCLAWADSWEGIRSAASGITSIQAEFEQQKHLPILTKPLVSKGVFYYRTPNSLRWEYRSPVQSILVMHNGRIHRWIKDSQTQNFRQESGASLDAMQVVFGEITQWLAGKFDENPLFAASIEPGYKIILTPKQKEMGTVLQRIEVELDAQPGVIRRVLIYESDAAYTEMIFTQTKLNQAIDTAVFQNVP